MQPCTSDLEPQVINNERQRCYAENHCFGHRWEDQSFENCILWYIYIYTYFELFIHNLQ